MKRAAIVAAGYAAVALGTFGYAAETNRSEAWSRYSVCQSVALNQIEGADYCRAPWLVDAPIVGLVSGALWPLYWSWTAVAATAPDREKGA